MIAIKGNKAYTVAEAEAQAWAARGYDVYGDEGIVERGKDFGGIPGEQETIMALAAKYV